MLQESRHHAVTAIIVLPLFVAGCEFIYAEGNDGDSDSDDHQPGALVLQYVNDYDDPLDEDGGALQMDEVSLRWVGDQLDGDGGEGFDYFDKPYIDTGYHTEPWEFQALVGNLATGTWNVRLEVDGNHIGACEVYLPPGGLTLRFETLEDGTFGGCIMISDPG